MSQGMPLIYVRGDPRTTKYVQKLLLISGLIQVTTTMYLTSTMWGDLMAELEAQYSGPESLMDPTRPPPWKTGAMKDRWQIGIGDPHLMVINSGTEDEQVCNMLNTKPAEVAAFGAARDRLRIS